MEPEIVLPGSKGFFKGRAKEPFKVLDSTFFLIVYTKPNEMKHQVLNAHMTLNSNWF
jgi:hypothetical protein